MERVSEQGKRWRSTVVWVSRTAVELCPAASLKHKSFLVLMRRRALAKLGGLIFGLGHDRARPYLARVVEPPCED